MVRQFEAKTKELIDSLKGICANYGLGNDGNEFKIITQSFLYKFMNDKFAYEIKKIDKKLNVENWEKILKAYSESEYEMLLMQLKPDTARLKPEHFIKQLFERQNISDFGKFFDDTLMDIAAFNSDVFSVITESGTKIQLFERLTEFIYDPRDHDPFARAVINKLVSVNFEDIYEQKYDFYSTIFEYLIKDYNKDGGGKYAEYYTPHAVAKIMAAILVKNPTQNVTVYDPSAGSGTLLMSVAHAIGEENCTILSQDISQKSSNLLRLNLILNNLVHSIPNIIKGNTITNPYHKDDDGKLEKFDFIVSNPPFKLDFSDFRDDIDTKENKDRFFAGIPNIPPKKKESMAIYELFIQHIMYSLKKSGKAAIVVPTGFITAQSGIDKRIREKLIDNKMLAGVVSMPSNIFATTGTNVSILFLDRTNEEDVVLIDASNLGEKVKDGKNQKTVLTSEEEQRIIETFNNKQVVDDFSVVVKYDEIKEKNYSLSAGQYFEIKIEYVDITHDEFEEKMNNYKANLAKMFEESRKLEDEILSNFDGLEKSDL
ncbi:MAG: class I SAM-dependent DNA methyltransferase [Candidatus Stygibacter frigidus]|nr:class I SAM-dependent DNA methyltransferase [Candidatus Stygibacter frigidus]